MPSMKLSRQTSMNSVSKVPCLKAYRDIDNAIKTAEKEKFAEGLAEGEKKKAQEVAKRMKGMGITAEMIAQATGLTPQEVERI